MSVDKPGNANPLLARIQQAQGAQRRVLMAHRRRVDAAAEEAAAAGEGVKAPAKPSLIVNVGYSAEGHGDALINAHVMFDALIEPIGKHMGCSPEDLEWMRENWGKGDELTNTLIDWSTKAILYPESVHVNDELRGCCQRVMQAGSAALSLEMPSEPRAEASDVQEASEAADADLELDTTLFASEHDAHDYSDEATVDQKWDRRKGMRGG